MVQYTSWISSSSSSNGTRSSVKGAKLNAMYIVGNIKLSEDTEITSDILGKVNVVTEHVQDNYVPAVECEFEKLIHVILLQRSKRKKLERNLC